MFRRSLPLRVLLATLALLLAPTPAAAESSVVAGSNAGASAKLNVRIVIPAVMRVVENSHPEQIVADANGAHTAQQRLVVVSNLRHGFCVTLRQTDPLLSGWRLQAVQESGVNLSPVDDGYRLCTARAGRYTLLLQHRFDASETATALRWPVQTDLMAL